MDSSLLKVTVFIKSLGGNVFRVVFIYGFFFYLPVRIKSEVLSFLLAILIIIKMFVLAIIIKSAVPAFQYGIAVMSFKN
jgi:hypothetical protein